MLKINIAILSVFFLLFVGEIASQDKENLLPNFYYEIVSFPDEASEISTTHIYIWIQNIHLQYLKQGDVYSARYQINIGISDSKGVSVLTEDRTFKATEEQYAATIEPKIKDVRHFQFKLSPGDYFFKIRLLDLNSNRIGVQEREKKIRAFDLNELNLSDVLFLNTTKTDTIKPSNIIPSFGIPVQEKIYLYAEIITPYKNSELKIESNLKSNSGKESFSFSEDIIPKNPITKILLQINQESMVQGVNKLQLKVTSGNQSKLVIKDVIFISGREGFAGLAIENMIEPLRYVTDGDDWKKMNNASEEEAEKAFREFWNQRDPTPGTPENELFNEFYKRVEYANKNFSYSRSSGWKTDRGRVYIVYGPPDRIQQTTPTAYTKGNYEIWYYEEIRETFEFYDEYGFGDYRLVSGNIRPAY